MEQDATVVVVIISTCTAEKWMLAVDASLQSHGLWRKTQIPWLAGHTQQRRMWRRRGWHGEACTLGGDVWVLGLPWCRGYMHCRKMCECYSPLREQVTHSGEQCGNVTDVMVNKLPSPELGCTNGTVGWDVLQGALRPASSNAVLMVSASSLMFDYFFYLVLREGTWTPPIIWELLLLPSAWQRSFWCLEPSVGLSCAASLANANVTSYHSLGYFCLARACFPSRCWPGFLDLQQWFSAFRMPRPLTIVPHIAQNYFCLKL